jgi:lysozyme
MYKTININMKTFLNWLNEENDESQYEIQSGDTLSDIAKRKGMKLEDLIKSNPQIKNPNKISAGQRLVTSGSNTPKPQSQSQQSAAAPNSTAVDWRQLVGKAEGIRTNAYWDENGRVWTIGKGSTTHPDGRPVKKGDVISPKQANEYMEHYVNTRVIPTFRKKIPNWDKMNPNQQNALISFGYNVGENFYGNSNFGTITTALSSPDRWGDVPAAMALYNKARDPKDKSRKIVLPGLVTRRKSEGNAWNTPVPTS